MAVRPSLLFLAPVMPAEGGNGLAMRMGVFLEAYARRFAVTLVVLPLMGAQEAEATPFIRRHVHRLVVIPPDRVLHPLVDLARRSRNPQERRNAMRAYPRPWPLVYDPIVARAAIGDHLGGHSFDLVHAGRAYLAPLADSWTGKVRCILDLDEDDASTLRRIAKLRRCRGDATGAADEESDADKYEALVAEYLPHFDVALVASEAEAARLGARHPVASVAVIPNAIRLPTPAPAQAAASLASSGPAPIDVLMVGTLGYYPNAEGALFFGNEILPLLGGATFTILGRKPPSSLLSLSRRRGVSLATDVADVAPYYAAARIAVVPIRAGGGSRIKILEAFAHGRPVVSTQVGAEGLAVTRGEHLLIADGAEGFAAAVRCLLDDATPGRRLASAARDLVAQRYSFNCVAGQIEALADRQDDMIESARWTAGDQMT